MNVVDNIFIVFKKEYFLFVWIVKEDDENFGWFFDKVDGSIICDGDVMFWYGIDNGDEIMCLMKDFILNGCVMFGDFNFELCLYCVVKIGFKLFVQ